MQARALVALGLLDAPSPIAPAPARPARAVDVPPVEVAPIAMPAAIAAVAVPAPCCPPDEAVPCSACMDGQTALIHMDAPRRFGDGLLDEIDLGPFDLTPLPPLADPQPSPVAAEESRLDLAQWIRSQARAYGSMTTQAAALMADTLNELARRVEVTGAADVWTFMDRENAMAAGR